MVENPINLFASRSDRYPESDEADSLQRLARAGIAAIPIVGGSLNELLSTVLAPAVSRRRDEWFKELADGLDQLESKVKGFRPEDLAKNEQFVSATIQATRIALGIHQNEKRAMLRNALLNVAVGNGPDEELQQVYLNAIEAFTPSHVRVLKALWRGDNELIEKHGRKPYELGNIGTLGNAIRILIPELQGRDGLVQCIMTDLRNRGFSTASGPDAAFPSGKMITNVGIEFLQFIMDPATRK
jgi:hypothetical protein